MGRRGGTIYVNTDPATVAPIGIGGVGVGIGKMGPTIFNAGVPTLLPTNAAITVTASASFQSIVYVFGTSGGTVSSLALTFTNGWIAEQVIEIYYNVAVPAITYAGSVSGSPTPPASAALGDTNKFVWRGGQWVYFT